MTFLLTLGILACIIGIYQSSNIFLASAVSLGRYYKLSNFIIGAIIVGFGTSSPELFVSMFSIFQNESSMVLGNVLGSNIANICLAIGFGTLASRCYIKFDNNILKEQNCYFTFSNCSAIILIFVFGYLSPYIGILMILGFCYFLYDSFKKREDEFENSTSLTETLSLSQYWICILLYGIFLYDIFQFSLLLCIFGTFIIGLLSFLLLSYTGKTPNILREYLIFIFGLGSLLVASNMTVNNVIELAESLDISSAILAATVIAIGTSIPEIAVSVLAARRKEYDILFGNIIGSNMINLLFVLPFSGLFAYITLDGLAIDALFVLCLTLICSLIIIRRQVSKFGMVAILGIYILYLYSCVVRL